jgi:serine/threonine protein kinase
MSAPNPHFQTERGLRLTLGTRLGQGGEASVYAVSGRPELVAKLYHHPPGPETDAKLVAMIAQPPANPTAALGHPSLAWPTARLLTLERRPQLVGFLMPRIDRTRLLFEVYHPRRRGSQVDARFLLRVARNLAAAVGALHAGGVIVGDLNQTNVLVTGRALVTLIDADSFQVTADGRVFPCRVGKPDFTAPEVGRGGEGVHQPASDDFALAVLVCLLLLDGNHPFRSTWLLPGDPPPLEEKMARGLFPYASPPLPGIAPPPGAPDFATLPPEIANLLRQTFGPGIRDLAARPTARQWETTIAAVEAGVPNPSAPRPRPSARPLRTPAPAAAPPSANLPRSRPFPRPAPGSGPARGASVPPIPFTPPSRSTPSLPTVWRLLRPVIGRAFGFGPLLRPAGPPQPLAARLGALAGSLGRGAAWGLLPGLGVALFALALGAATSAVWGWTVVLGAALAGLQLGWQPGERLGSAISLRLGWRRFWMGGGGMFGAVSGAGFAALPGLLTGPGVILFALGGGALGGMLGSLAGQRLWLAGSRLGWDRLWRVAAAVSAVGLGTLAVTPLMWPPLAASGVAAAQALTTWLSATLAAALTTSAAGDLAWVASLMVGTLLGALGGAAAGLALHGIIRLAERV